MSSYKNQGSSPSSGPHAVSQMGCPSCRGPLVPVRLHCSTCDLSVEGKFQGSEFSNLAADDLHFLRIFIHCEGSIREMESALGLSYPTIKSRLANLKKTLSSGVDASVAKQVDAPVAKQTDTPALKTELKTVGDVLTALEQGAITHAESLKLIKKLK